MKRLAPDATEVVTFIEELAHANHDMAHAPYDRSVTGTPFAECRASICEEARDLLVRLDEPQLRRSGG